jgi:tryptophanyl-tRNA synthetase
MKYVTGIRPTGNIHLGNYLGAIKQARKLGCMVFVADLHGIHSREEVMKTAKILIDIGLDVDIQSHFPKEHLILYANLLQYAKIGHLSRMTQYKEKSEKEAQVASLLTYPVLMAADIFYLQGTHIPVGNDQVQHIEFIRDLHDKLPEKSFPKPEAVVSEYPRIMSLTDGTKKMSKSEPDDMSRINIIDNAETIRRKIMVAKTAMSIDDDTPEMVNLRTIYKAVGGKEKHTRFKDFKTELADLIIAEVHS